MVGLFWSGSHWEGGMTGDLIKSKYFITTYESRLMNSVKLFIILFYCFAFIDMYKHYLDHLPLPPPPGRMGPALLFADSVEKNIKDNKKNMVFLLV
jgi:hypothetical protein